MVTVVHNGVTTIDHKEIEGITGGALDANEGEPGPFYIQGDHTGGLKFRNITVSVPARPPAILQTTTWLRPKSLSCKALSANHPSGWRLANNIPLVCRPPLADTPT
jgi:hypothetical protein